MSLTLVFSQGKPCCKNKSGKSKVSCKFNQAQIGAKVDDIVADDGIQQISNTGVQCPNKPGCTGCTCSKVLSTSNDQKKCDSCANTKWWKFWVKKKNCCSTKS